MVLVLVPLEDDMRTGRKELLVKRSFVFHMVLVALVVAICTRKSGFGQLIA
jgi:hypothetical protein